MAQDRLNGGGSTDDNEAAEGAQRAVEETTEGGDIEEQAVTDAFDDLGGDSDNEAADGTQRAVDQTSDDGSIEDDARDVSQSASNDSGGSSPSDDGGGDLGSGSVTSSGRQTSTVLQNLLGDVVDDSPSSSETAEPTETSSTTDRSQTTAPTGAAAAVEETTTGGGIDEQAVTEEFEDTTSNTGAGSQAPAGAQRAVEETPDAGGGADPSGTDAAQAAAQAVEETTTGGSIDEQADPNASVRAAEQLREQQAAAERRQRDLEDATSGPSASAESAQQSPEQDLAEEVAETASNVAQTGEATARDLQQQTEQAGAEIADAGEQAVDTAAEAADGVREQAVDAGEDLNQGVNETQQNVEKVLSDLAQRPNNAPRGAESTRTGYVTPGQTPGQTSPRERFGDSEVGIPGTETTLEAETRNLARGFSAAVDEGATELERQVDITEEQIAGATVDDGGVSLGESDPTDDRSAAARVAGGAVRTLGNAANPSAIALGLDEAAETSRYLAGRAGRDLGSIDSEDVQGVLDGEQGVGDLSESQTGQAVGALGRAGGAAVGASLDPNFNTNTGRLDKLGAAGDDIAAGFARIEEGLSNADEKGTLLQEDLSVNQERADDFQEGADLIGEGLDELNEGDPVVETREGRGAEVAGGIVGGVAAAGLELGASAAAGRALGRAARAGRDRVRTAGAERVDLEDVSPEETAEYYNPDSDTKPPEGRFPGFQNRDTLRESQRRALIEDAEEFTPDAMQKRFDEAGVDRDGVFFKALGAEPEGPDSGRLQRAGGGFQAPEPDSDLADAYETRGTSFGPAVSPNFLGEVAGRSPDFSFVPGLPSLGDRSTVVAAGTDVTETDASNVGQLNQELLDNAGDTDLRTLSPDETSPGEAEALAAPGAEFQDLGGGPLRSLARRAGIGSDFAVDVGSRRVPFRLVVPDDSPDAPTRSGGAFDLDDFGGDTRGEVDLSQSQAWDDLLGEQRRQVDDLDDEIGGGPIRRDSPDSRSGDGGSGGSRGGVGGGRSPSRPPRDRGGDGRRRRDRREVDPGTDRPVPSPSLPRDDIRRPERPDRPRRDRDPSGSDPIYRPPSRTPDSDGGDPRPPTDRGGSDPPGSRPPTSDGGGGSGSGGSGDPTFDPPEYNPSGGPGTPPDRGDIPPERGDIPPGRGDIPPGRGTSSGGSSGGGQSRIVREFTGTSFTTPTPGGPVDDEDSLAKAFGLDVTGAVDRRFLSGIQSGEELLGISEGVEADPNEFDVGPAGQPNDQPAVDFSEGEQVEVDTETSSIRDQLGF